MAIVCPTVLAEDPHAFREQIERIMPFSTRIQIDLTDQLFARTPTIALDQIWLPDDVEVDIHLMFERPDLYLDMLVRLSPRLVIVHAEAKGDFTVIADTLHEKGIRVGLALLQETPVAVIEPVLAEIDHVLIFSGHLGHFGGHADLNLLDKVAQLKHHKSSLEVGWDGGISPTNIQQLVEGGVDVLNVGGFIQQAKEPKTAYDRLVEIAGAPIS